MLALAKTFFDICLLRLRPQDLPASVLLLSVTLIAYAVSTSLLSAVVLPFDKALLAGLMDTALLSLLTISVLYFQGLHARFVQTFTALTGSGAVLAVIGLPLSSWLYNAIERGDSPAVPALLSLLLLAWGLTVVGHILRHALSTVFFLGLVLAIVFYWVTLNVLNAFFPISVQ